MIRLLIKSPTGLNLDLLSQEQKSAISSVFASFVNPIPGTISYGAEEYEVEVSPETIDETGNVVPAVTETLVGKSIIDAVVNDNFDPASIGALGLPFEIIASWKWNGISELETLVPLDETFINHLPDVVEYGEVEVTPAELDADGNIITPAVTEWQQISTSAPTLNIPHNWAGWPEVVL